jgi:hypothetical protein
MAYSAGRLSHAQRRLGIWYNPLVSQPRVLFSHRPIRCALQARSSFVVNMLRYHDRACYRPVVYLSACADGGRIWKRRCSRWGFPLHFFDVSETSAFAGCIDPKTQRAIQKSIVRPIVHTHLGGIRLRFRAGDEASARLCVFTLYITSHRKRWARGASRLRSAARFQIPTRLLCAHSHSSRRSHALLRLCIRLSHNPPSDSEWAFPCRTFTPDPATRVECAENRIGCEPLIG